jgi:hypothetical protein
MWLLPMPRPHHPGTLYFTAVLVILTYLEFLERARLAQGWRLCSMESFSGVASPPLLTYPSVQ